MHVPILSLQYEAERERERESCYVAMNILLYCRQYACVYVFVSVRVSGFDDTIYHVL